MSEPKGVFRKHIRNNRGKSLKTPHSFKSDFNKSFTDYLNTVNGRRLSEKDISFLRKAYAINKEQRPFSTKDFPHLTSENFRQYIRKFKQIIEIVIKSRPCFYKLKGMQMAGDSHKLTKRVMGEGMIDLLSTLKDQPPSIHDIKIMFKSEDLHKNLLKNGFPQHSQNKGILVEIPKYHPNIMIKSIVYPKTIQIDIGCSYKPIVYDISGIISLSSILGEVYGYLKFCSGAETNIPETNTWIITHYHFGKDSKERHDYENFHYTIEEGLEGFSRFYSKLMPNKKTILRCERITTPQKKVGDELINIIKQNKISTVCINHISFSYPYPLHL